MSRSRRKPYHHGNLREALLRAARRLVEAEGPEAVSFRKLADAVDVSHAAPLAHFPDRLSLEAALAAEGFREVRHRCEQLGSSSVEPPLWGAKGQSLVARLNMAMSLPLPSRYPPRRASAAARSVFGMQLVTAALVHLRFALEHPGLYRVMYASDLAERLREAGTPGRGGEEPFRELAEEKSRAFAVFADLVRAGQEAGEFRTDLSPDQAARLVTALAEGLARQYLEEGRGSDRLRDAEGLFEMVVTGFRG